jgi:hypothetical protein
MARGTAGRFSFWDLGTPEDAARAKGDDDVFVDGFRLPDARRYNSAASHLRK